MVETINIITIHFWSQPQLPRLKWPFRGAIPYPYPYTITNSLFFLIEVRLFGWRERRGKAFNLDVCGSRRGSQLVWGEKKSMEKRENCGFWRWVLYDFGAGFCWIEILRCFEVIEFFSQKTDLDWCLLCWIVCLFQMFQRLILRKPTPGIGSFITLNSKSCMFYLGGWKGSWWSTVSLLKGQAQKHSEAMNLNQAGLQFITTLWYLGSVLGREGFWCIFQLNEELFGTRSKSSNRRVDKTDMFFSSSKMWGRDSMCHIPMAIDQKITPLKINLLLYPCLFPSQVMNLVSVLALKMVLYIL